jgi:7-carboxy-7-deazaguanine synthase (Cx14CxxC type)
MAYSVKEIYYTLQGEGHNTGRPAVLCRFTGCNLWSGRERDRATATCSFCDTDFVGRDGPGGGRFAGPAELASVIAARWPGGGRPFIVFTGGEPLLQLDDRLLDEVHALGFEAAVETNGTLAAPEGLDWICVSPKAGAPLRQMTGDELKIVYPQDGLTPEDFAGLEFAHFFLQPLDGPDLRRNTERAVRYCLEHPRWRLSLQTHKVVGIP